ncbi:MAG: 3-hydroxyacyl-CoA dehydrogenase family protein [Myxococcales bacterium]|nr:3-hydroxyacyl-CoA dehydrogenase family protein [Myxococcales bacterium]
MGEGIAQVTASAGLETRVFDAAEGRAAKAVAGIAARLERLVGKGTLDEPRRARALAALRALPDIAGACSGADLVLEAAPEDLDVKVHVLGEAIAAAPAGALVASNTSSLSLTELGTRLGAGERTLGLHFFNPAPVMELVEVVRGRATADAAVDLALDFVRAIGKTPIVVRDVAGFASSRLGLALGAEAIRMVEDGVAGVREIDLAMELGYRHPMGPLRLTDLVGLDVRLAILEHLARELGERFRPPALLRAMVRDGALGKKAGRGFYVWRDGIAGEAAPLPRPEPV